MTVCDHCGNTFASGHLPINIREIPFPVHSVNAGESATLHKKCFVEALAAWVAKYYPGFQIRKTKHGYMVDV